MPSRTRCYLARAYADRPAEEWKPLFYRILENRIRDMQRRRTVRGRVLAWLPSRGEDDDEDAGSDCAGAEFRAAAGQAAGDQDEAMGAPQKAGNLRRCRAGSSRRFLLRSSEGLDVADTARAMGCSEGSVKTHYFRAVQTLRSKLGDLYV